MGIQQDVIKKFVKSLDNSTTSGMAAFNAAVKDASSGVFSSWSNLVSSFISDLKNYGGKGSSSTTTLDTRTDSFLKNYCGIILDNNDTGAITGSDAGGGAVKTATSIVPESSTKAVYPTVSSSTINGVTIKWPSASSLSSKSKEIVSGLYTWWIKSALDLVENSIGISFKEDDVVSKNMVVSFERSKTDSVLASANLYKLTIYTNSLSTVNVTGASNSGSRSKGAYFDRILAHEMTHAIMSANESSALWNSSLVCIDEGLAEVVHGADDTRRSEIIGLAQSASASHLEEVLYYDYHVDDYYDAYAGGYMLFRYLAKQTALALDGSGVDLGNTESNVNFKGTAIVDLSKASGNGIFIVDNTSTGKVKATFTTKNISNGQTKVGKITSKNVYKTSLDLAQSITASSSSKAWKINGSSGNDTITGGSGNDTMTGGKGNDTFVYASGGGDDVITDYTADEDVIKISSGSISSSSISGSDVILKIGKGSIKIKKGKDKKITIIDSKNKTTSQVYGSAKGISYNSDSTAITLTSDFGNTLNTSDYYSTVKTINASKRTKAIYINGNSLDNSIRGGSGADTINGGTGNDTLTGGSGDDVFIYASGGGNDIITDYTVGHDSIKLTSGSISSSSINGSDIVLKIGSGSIKIKNGKGKKITIIDSASKSTTKVYSDTSSVSNSAITLTNKDSATFKAASNILTINSTSRTKPINITANSLANTIRCGSGDDVIDGGSGNDSISGGAGADTITGGKGNDTLTGGRGNNVFVYSKGDGNDVITDYKATDNLKISGSYSTQVSGSDVIVKVGTGSIKLLNAKNKTININTSKNYSENIEEHWFTQDDKFISTGNDVISAELPINNSSLSSIDSLSKVESYSLNIVNELLRNLGKATTATIKEK